MTTIALTDTPLDLPALLDRVTQGEQFTLTRQGIPVARLVPPAETLRPFVEYPSDTEYVQNAARLAAAQGLDPADAAAIAQGIADGEAGREQSLEEYLAERTDVVSKLRALRKGVTLDGLSLCDIIQDARHE